MVFLLKKETYRLMNLSEKEIDRIIEMAWEDRTPFEAIEFQFGNLHTFKKEEKEVQINMEFFNL